MDTLLLCASPRKIGNCHSIIEHLHTALPRARVLFLSDFTIKPCIDCKACKTNSKEKDFCIHDEEENNTVKELFQALYSAKNIILVSPIYFYHAPSQLKALVDRAQRFWFANSCEKALSKRKIFAIYAAGRKRGEKIPQGLDLSIKYFAPLIQGEFVQSLCLYGLEEEEDFKNSAQSQKQVDAFIEFCKNPIAPAPPISYSPAKTFWTLVSEYLFQKRCLYCKKPYSTNDFKIRNIDEIFSLCPDCSSSLKRKTTGFCMRCGSLQEHGLEEHILSSCPLCEEKPVPWDNIRFYAAYEGILQDLIRYAKFYNKFIYTRALADLIKPLLDEFDDFDMLIPIPMHNKKLVNRGYNQCNEIAKHLNKIANISIDYNVLYKDKETKAQASLAKEQRQKNLKNAFSVDNSKVKGKNIVLLDDVSTTGSTLREATKALKQAGANKVFVLYVAGAPLHSL